MGKNQVFVKFLKIFLTTGVVATVAISQPMQFSDLQSKFSTKFNHIKEAVFSETVKTAIPNENNSLQQDSNRSVANAFQIQESSQTLSKLNNTNSLNINNNSPIIHTIDSKADPQSCSASIKNVKDLFLTGNYSRTSFAFDRLSNSTIQTTQLASASQNQEYESNGGERGAGEYWLALFKSLDEAFLEDLPKLHKRGVFLDMSVEQEKQVMYEFRMSISETQLFDRFGERVDAITDRLRKEIIFDESILGSPKITSEQIIQIFLHELCRRYSETYFQLEDSYQKSIPLFQELVKLGSQSELMNAAFDQRDRSQFFRFIEKSVGGSKTGAMITCSASNNGLEILIDKTASGGGLRLQLKNLSKDEQNYYVVGRKLKRFDLIHTPLQYF